MMRTLASLCAISTLVLLAAGCGGAAATQPAAEPVYADVLEARDSIKRVLALHGSDIRRCYEAELTATPGLSGGVTVRWEYGNDGRVVSATALEDTLDSLEVEACLVREILGMQFEPHGFGLARVQHRFEFVPRGSDVATSLRRVSGFLSRAQIESVVRRRATRIRYCYERELVQDPSLAGRVVLNWTIGFNGRIESATIVEDTMGNSDVSSCIHDIVLGMQFDKPDGGIVIVTYPFTFRSEEE